jgi:peptidoglycan/LPS O-acetylase OafA/YrhL
VSIPRIPALDGLRGLAILMVFAGHVALFGSTPGEASNPIVHLFAVNNGLGVDLFFVLSGFLITGILYDSKGHDSFFKTFYIRRTLRIFPLYYATLAIVTVGHFALPGVFALANISNAALVANATYTTNFLLAFRGWGSEPGFLAHFWSLAVEEQFYLLWPVVVFSLSRKALLKIAAIGIVTAPLIRIVLLRTVSYEAAYTLLPARMDALLVGATIALAARSTEGIPDWAKARAVRVTAGLIFAVSAISATGELPGMIGSIIIAARSTVSSIAFGALLVSLISVTELTGWKRFFSAPFARFFGRYSYAMYVFHLAVIFFLPKVISVVSQRALGHEVQPGLINFGLIALAVTVTAALVSWRLIEKPFLDLKDRVSVPRAAYPPELVAS